MLKRRHPRFPYDHAVALRAEGSSTFETLRALDIGLGGVFVATRKPLPLLTEGLLAVRKPEGGSCLLQVRVVRLVSGATSSAEDAQPGMGLEFCELDAIGQDVVERLVWLAHMRDSRRRIPRATAQAADHKVSDPMLAYVLAAVDGRRSPELLAEALGVEHDGLAEMLRALWKAGLVEFGRGDESGRVVADGNGSPELATAADRDRQAGAQSPCELTATERARIDAVHERIGLEDHYAILDVSPDVSANGIHQAFAALARLYHPDGQSGRALGDYAAKLAAVYERIRAAYVVLGHPGGRAEYDRFHEGSGSTQSSRAAESSASSTDARKQRARELESSLRRSGVAFRAIERPRDAQAEAPRQVDAPHQVEPARQPEPARHAQPRAQHSPLARPTAAVDAMRSTLPGGSLASRCLDEAEQALRDGNAPAAARALELVRCMEHEDDRWRARHERLFRVVAVRMAPTHEQRARYAERTQRWQEAARNWVKVCDGRPEDAECQRHAAHCLLESGDARGAYAHATHAVELDPGCAQAHQVLGHVLLAAGLKLRARRSLEEASRLRAPELAPRRRIFGGQP